MTSLLLLAAQAASLAAPPAPAPVVTVPPANWATLPTFVLPTGPAGGVHVSAFVAAEVKAGRCRAVATEGMLRVDSPVAILVTAAGTVRQVVPQAIGCPTVEQYTVGYVSTLTRGAADREAIKPGWYRLAVTYQWQG